MNLVRCILMTAFGLGLLRPAPGTWASMATALVVLGLFLMGMRHAHLHLTSGLLFALFAAACVLFGGYAETMFGQKDPSKVVSDEVAGQALALVLLPWPDQKRWRALVMAAVAFLTFRFFDIVKPLPIDRLEGLPGGWGIVMDDILAGVYALVITQIVIRLLFLPGRNIA